jgi:hypothetical protein
MVKLHFVIRKLISIILNNVLSLEVGVSVINLETGLKMQGNKSTCCTHLAYFLSDDFDVVHCASATCVIFLCWLVVRGKVSVFQTEG